jgi:hypothetical protein
MLDHAASTFFFEAAVFGRSSSINRGGRKARSTTKTEEMVEYIMVIIRLVEISS